MGAEFSSCCSGGNGLDHNSQQDVLSIQNTTCSDQQLPLTDLKKKFRKRFEQGLTVELILQKLLYAQYTIKKLYGNKTMLTCQMRLDPANEFLLLTCDKKIRAIGMNDIKSILHTPDQLRRIESSANIVNNSTCAAIHLAESGNCIPIFFASPEDKNLFVVLVEEAREAVSMNKD